MPKLKSKNAITKRIKLTATGKVKGPHSGRRHLLINKSQKTKRHARHSATMSECATIVIKKYIPGA